MNQSAPIVAFVTIGRSPRDDMIPELLQYLGTSSIIEWGALDGLSRQEIDELKPAEGERMVVSRLESGDSVRMAKRHLDPRIQVGIKECEQRGADVVVVTCTSEFPRFEHTKPLLVAGQLLRGVIPAVVGGCHLGVVCPDAAQVDFAVEEWSTYARKVSALVATPYSEGAADFVGRCAEDLCAHGADYVFLDCMGYTREMQAAARNRVGNRVLLARTLVARVVGEFVA
jgi:protein AroM